MPHRTAPKMDEKMDAHPQAASPLPCPAPPRPARPRPTSPRHAEPDLARPRQDTPRPAQSNRGAVAKRKFGGYIAAAIRRGHSSVGGQRRAGVSAPARLADLSYQEQTGHASALKSGNGRAKSRLLPQGCLLQHGAKLAARSSPVLPPIAAAIAALRARPRPKIRPAHAILRAHPMPD